MVCHSRHSQRCSGVCAFSVQLTSSNFFILLQRRSRSEPDQATESSMEFKTSENEDAGSLSFHLYFRYNNKKNKQNNNNNKTEAQET